MRVAGLVTVHGVRLIEGRDGEFLGAPARRIGDKWHNLVEFSPELTSEIAAAMHAAAVFDDDAAGAA